MEGINPFIQTLVTIICSVFASSGLWALVQKRMDKNDARTRMIKGLGHSEIMRFGMKYITRGWITKDEYEDLCVYLYEPYKALGGNGSAERIMEEVKRLPIKDIRDFHKEVN